MNRASTENPVILRLKSKYRLKIKIFNQWRAPIHKMQEAKSDSKSER